MTTFRASLTKFWPPSPSYVISGYCVTKRKLVSPPVGRNPLTYIHTNLHTVLTFRNSLGWLVLPAFKVLRFSGINPDISNLRPNNFRRKPQEKYDLMSDNVSRSIIARAVCL